MEILRVPPYPITTTWDVPEAEHAYLIYVEDVVDHSVETLSVVSDANAKVQYVLPRAKIQYDRDFALRIHDTDINGEIVVDSNLTVYRPYVDPNMLAKNSTELEEYKSWEIIARAIMDAYLQNDSANGEGFYNHKLIIQGIGEGTDYFPVWHNPKRILKVYENNVLVFDADDSEVTTQQFAIAANNSAIVKVMTGEMNRFESSPARLPLAAGDLNYYGRAGTSFPKGYDYTFILDVGYKAVPPDVEKAAIMLINDLKCGNNEYWKRFVTQYNTDQFSIKYAPEFLKGTGNLIVDKILDGYKGNVIKPGVI
jgi:hypothetical protein